VKSYTPSVNLSLQPRGAKIAMLFDTSVRCGRDIQDVAGSGEVPWDGTSFSFKGGSVRDLGRGRLAHEFTVTGQLSGGHATGTLHVVGVRRRSGRSQKCAQRPNRAFEVRFAGPPAGGPAKPLSRAFYAGTSSYEIFDRIQAPVTLRVTKDAKKVAGQWTIAAKCGRGASTFVNFSPPMRLRANGSFSSRERFSIRYTDGVIRYRASFAGRFATDGATGTLRLRTREFNRRGKRTPRCDSGTRRWNAAPPPTATAPSGGGTTPTPAPSGTQAHSPLPASSGVSMTSDEGDYVGQGKTFDGVGGPIVAEARRDERVTLGVLSGGEWRANFAAPPGQELTEGVTYTGAKRWPFNESAPGLSISGEGRGCGYSTGSFTVDHISWYPDGTLQAFSARFEQHCEDAVPALRGTWTYRHT
jgi:hypothetical protein